MKRILFLIFIFFMARLNIFPLDTIVIKDGEDYLEKLISNEVYFKFIRDVEYDNGLLYLLEFEYGAVLVVDFKSGKLLKTLFRRGQGPYELMTPMCLKVKNQKVFVLDQGFNGIKIVDLKGNSINEFRTKGMAGRRNIDVNDQDKIFVGEYNTPTKTYVSVYNINGEKERSFIKLKSYDNLPLQRIHYNIMLDEEGNILMLFNVLRELKKFNSNGDLIWELKIKNKLLDKDYNDDGVKITKNGAIKTRISIFDINITKNNNILIGHDYGGSIYDKNGELKSLITLDPIGCLFLFEVIDNKLINIFAAGKKMNLFDIKEVIK